MSISIGGGGGGGGALLATATLDDYVSTGPPGTQTVAPGAAVRFASSGAIVQNAALSPMGDYVQVSGAGVYNVSVQFAPNLANVAMLAQVLVDGVPLPTPPTRQWIYSVLRLAAGQRVAVVNADAAPYTLDAGPHSVYFDLVQRS